MNTQINISHKQLFNISIIAAIIAVLLAICTNNASAQDRTITLQEAITLGLQNSQQAPTLIWLLHR
jgi:outer membrane protein